MTWWTLLRFPASQKPKSFSHNRLMLTQKSRSRRVHTPNTDFWSLKERYISTDKNQRLLSSTEPQLYIKQWILCARSGWDVRVSVVPLLPRSFLCNPWLLTVTMCQATKRTKKTCWQIAKDEKITNVQNDDAFNDVISHWPLCNKERWKESSFPSEPLVWQKKNPENSIFSDPINQLHDASALTLPK